MGTSRIVPSHVSEEHRATLPAFFESQTSDSHKQIAPVDRRSNADLHPTTSRDGPKHYSMVSPDQYTIAIVCAMTDEAEPVQALFDNGQLFCTYSGPSYDHNIYIVGQFAGHHTVLVTPGEPGELDSGLCTQRLRILFPNIELTLLVGICGAACKNHQTKEDIYLGDVIVGNRVWRWLHNARSSQLDTGQGVNLQLRNLQTESTSERVKQLSNHCQSRFLRERIISGCVKHLDYLTKKYPMYAYPGCGMDTLFEPNYLHQDQSRCECEAPSETIDSSVNSASGKRVDGVVKRRRSINESPPRPHCHVGTFASADVVMRASDTFAKHFADNNVLGIDMEGGGVSKATDCMVIKSAVDYADTHKNKDFRYYAAATAASFAKASLEVLFQRNKSGPETKHLQSIICQDFKTANKGFAQALRLQDRNDFGPTATYESLYESTRSIQDIQGLTNTLRGLSSIEPLIFGIEKYIQAVELLVNLDFDVANCLWGPLKYLLESSQLPIKTFERVTGVLADVGRSFPGFEILVELCQRNEETKSCLPLLYQDILDLFAVLLNYASMTQTQELHESLWKNSLRKVEIIRSNILHHYGLVIGKVGFSHINQARSDHQTLLNFDNEQDFREAQNFTALRHELQIDSYDPPSPGAFHIERREWLRKEPLFGKWLNTSTKKNRCLWIRGIPGSGKTFLTLDTLYQLQTDKCKVLRVFLRHRNQTTYISVLQSLLFQAVELNGAYRPMLQDLCHEQRHTDIKQVGELLSAVINDSEPIFIIVDGLDETDTVTSDRVLTCLLGILNRCPKSRLLISSRAQYDILQRLEKKSISLRVDEKNGHDIEKYTQRRGEVFLQQLRDEMGVDDATLAEIGNQMEPIASKSNGMFLYARLVMDVVTEMGSVEEIQDQIENLPDGLDQAYDRILSHIRRIGNENIRSDVFRILQWLVCARCELRETELLQALAVVPHMKDFQSSRARFYNIRKVCGPIVEENNGFIQFVHFSAKEYLIHHQSNNFIILRQAHLEVAHVCLTYLSFSSFNILPSSIDSNSLDKHKDSVLAGDLVLYHFAATQWLYHVKQCIFSLSWDQSTKLRQSLSSFFKDRLRSSHRTAPLAAMPYSLASQPLVMDSLLREAQIFEDKLKTGELDQEGSAWVTQDPTEISAALLNVRNALEASLDAESEPLIGASHDRIIKLYGKNPYFCNWAFCPHYRTGFPDRSTRQEHLRIHSRPFRCPEGQCIFSHLGFRNEELLARHITEFHQTNEVSSADEVAVENYLNRLRMLDSRVLLDQAIANNQINLVVKIFQTDIPLDERNYESFLLTAASKASGKMIDIILDDVICFDEWAHFDLNGPVLTAIRAKNLSAIRGLLSRDAGGYNQARQINKTTVAEYALKTWDAEIVGILVDEFSIELPVYMPNDIFSDFVETRRHLDDDEEFVAEIMAMKRYIIWPKAYTEGVTAALELRSPACLNFFLSNGGSPHEIKFDLIWRIVNLSTAKDIKLVTLLLQHGSDIGMRLQQPGDLESPAALRKIEKHFGMNWRELVLKLGQGMLLAGVEQ